MSIIAVNAMGGDNAPEAIVRGAHLAAADGIEIVLVGDENILRPLTHLAVVHAPVTIEMDEDPVAGFRRSRQSSIHVASSMVQNGDADALVDCGNTGVALTAATVLFRTFAGFERPTIATKMPRVCDDLSIKYSLLLDSGANISPTPSMMAQWGLLGSHFMRLTSTVDSPAIESPLVGLVSNGEEANKGNELVKVTHGMLANISRKDLINFIGNVQGGGVFDGSADVVITDGFTGNAMLKLAETLAKMQFDALKNISERNFFTKLGGLLLRPHLRPIKQAMDKKQAGGALLLGVRKVCIIGHGSSDEIAAANAIRRAHEAIDSGIVPRLQENYETAIAA